MASGHDELEAPQGLIAGKYRLSKLLGRGGMGAVWEGVHATLGTRVAVKFIDKQHASSDDIRQRFVNEAKAAARLRSKHVVQVYDQGVTEDGRPYIVMEFLAGEALDARLDRVGRLPPEDTARILLQVARALAKAHDANIVHRDLKPENVFLVWDEDDQMDIVKVVDFGIAKFTDGTAGSTSGSTQTGAVLGTPHYMSPEQARGLRSLDLRTDVWSLGVIAYRCIVGQLPFDGVAVGDLLVNICTASPPVPSTVAPDVPAGFDEFVVKALAREPGDRYRSALELAEALCAVCKVEVRGTSASMMLSSSRGAPRSIPASSPGPRRDPGAVTEVPLTKTLSGSSKRQQLVIGLGAVAALLVGLGGFFAVRSARSEPPAAVTAEPSKASVSAAAASVERETPEPPTVTPVVSAAPEMKPAPSAEEAPAPAPSAKPTATAIAAPAAKPVVRRHVPTRPAPPPPKKKPRQDLLGY